MESRLLKLEHSILFASQIRKRFGSRWGGAADSVRDAHETHQQRMGQRWGWTFRGLLGPGGKH